MATVPTLKQPSILCYRIEGWRFVESPEAVHFWRTWFHWAVRMALLLMGATISALVVPLVACPWWIQGTGAAVILAKSFLFALGLFGCGSALYLGYWFCRELRDGRAEIVLDTSRATLRVGTQVVAQLSEIAAIEVGNEPGVYKSNPRHYFVEIKFQDHQRHPFRISPLNYGQRAAQRIVTVLAAHWDAWRAGSRSPASPSGRINMPG